MVTNGGRFDWAVWDPISGRSTQANRVDRMTIHTAVTSSSDIYGPGKGPGGTYAHFYSPLSGKLRQHQEIHHKAYADLNANGYTVAVEHQDNAHEMPLSDNQIDNDARLFAHLVTHYGTPNRIATVDNTKGLAWHRLGIDGNFGAYNPSDRTTWCKKQTGQSWSNAFGKLCPYNTRIRQIDAIYKKAQTYLGGSAANTTGDDTEDTQPTPKPDTGDDMAGRKYVTRTYTTDQPLKNGAWQTIKVNGDKDTKSPAAVMSGPADIIGGEYNVAVEGLKPGEYALMRLFAADTDPDGPDPRTATGWTTRLIPPASGGTARASAPIVWDLGGPAKGHSNRNLRIEVKAVAKAARVSEAHAKFWWLKP